MRHHDRNGALCNVVIGRPNSSFLSDLNDALLNNGLLPAFSLAIDALSPDEATARALRARDKSALERALARRGDEAMSHAEMRAITEAPPSPSRTEP